MLRLAMPTDEQDFIAKLVQLGFSTRLNVESYDVASSQYPGIRVHDAATLIQLLQDRNLIRCEIEAIAPDPAKPVPPTRSRWVAVKPPL
mgnify:CR=1 FL=1